MDRFALLRDGDTVHEIITVPSGGPSLDELYHPELVARMVPAPAEVEVGWVFDGAGFAPPAPPVLTAAEARAERDARLALTDWTQIADAPLSRPERQAWAAYRAALRALPAQPGWPADITWPAPPT